MLAILNVVIKSTLLLAVAWLAVRAIGRRAAAERYLVWCAAVAALVALPVWSVLGPRLSVPVPQSVAEPVARFVAEAAAPAAQATAGAVTGAARASQAAAGSVVRAWSWSEWLALVWAAGAVVAAGRLLLGLWQVTRLHSDAIPLQDSEWRAVLDDAARQLGVECKVGLYETARAGVPMTAGWREPAIYLPPAARDWDSERRRVVLLHEMAHVRRRDALTGFIAQAALCGYWWHPLAWIASAAVLRERERAADDMVLAAGARPSDYAGHLLELASTYRASAAGMATAAICMARPSQLEGRLGSILDARVRRAGAVKPALALAAMVAAVVLALPVAAMRPSPQEAAPQTTAADMDALIRSALTSRNHATLERLASEMAAYRKKPEAERLTAAAVEARAARFGERSPEYAQGLVENAKVLRAVGKWGEAEAQLEKALAIEESAGAANPGTLQQLAAAVDSHKQHDKAKALYQRALGLRPSPELEGRLHIGLGLVEQEQGEPEAAIAQYRAALQVLDQQHRDRAVAQDLLARSLKDSGQAGEAAQLEASAAAMHAEVVARDNRTSVSSVLKMTSDGSMTVPKLLTKVEPMYSDAARAARLSGRVTLLVVVGTSGRAESVTLKQGLGLGLDEAAADAVRLWQFSPATKNGAPVAVSATIEVNFRLM